MEPTELPEKIDIACIVKGSNFGQAMVYEINFVTERTLMKTLLAVRFFGLID